MRYEFFSERTGRVCCRGDFEDALCATCRQRAGLSPKALGRDAATDDEPVKRTPSGWADFYGERLMGFGSLQLQPAPDPYRVALTVGRTPLVCDEGGVPSGYLTTLAAMKAARP